MNKLSLLVFILTIVIFSNCNSENQSSKLDPKTDQISFEITSLSDQDYPDNPDIGFRSVSYQNDFFADGYLQKQPEAFHYDFFFLTKQSDTLALRNINISELIPTIPVHLRSNEYLSYISCINQEWNRNQIKFVAGEFSTTLPKVVRLDLARNCLNSYLWEIILYIEEDEQTVPYAHGWFDFPHDLYAQLFEEKNGIPFSKYQKALENWVDPVREKINLDHFGHVVQTLKIKFKDQSDAMYPLKAARKKKFKEIIYPTSFSTMRDLQSDSTLFATFTPPGFYNKKDPRKTELGRFYNLENIELSEIKAPGSSEHLYEIQLTFSHKNKKKFTKLVIGGIHLDDFPVLEESEANQGWKNSMGIGNHSFYETYKDHINKPSMQSSYYALLLDGEDRWLDSHTVGIDGPIFHFSDEEKRTLHLWLLSFERHALVGHYEIEMK